MRRAKRFDAAIIEDGGKVVASGWVFLYEVHPRPDRPGPYEPYILSMFTEPAHRGRGIAQAIVNLLLEWARKHGYRNAFLHASDMGRRIYESVRFRQTAEMRLTGC